MVLKRLRECGTSSDFSGYCVHDCQWVMQKSAFDKINDSHSKCRVNFCWLIDLNSKLKNYWANLQPIIRLQPLTRLRSYQFALSGDRSKPDSDGWIENRLYYCSNSWGGSRTSSAGPSRWHSLYAGRQFEVHGDCTPGKPEGRVQ